jgi:hypothetical protein
MSRSRSNVWKALPAALGALATVSMAVVFSFDVHASHIQWHIAAGSGAEDVLGECASLFGVGAGLAFSAAALRRLIHQSVSTEPRRSCLASPSHSTS